MKIGYARCSSDTQTTAMQVDALKKAGCDHIYEDKAKSGSSRLERVGLGRCLKMLRPGDTLIVWKLDRLGRTLRDLLHLMETFKQDGVHFQSLTENIETETITGRAMFQMFGVMAELERNIIRERCAAGVAAARERGVRPGAKHKISKENLDYARRLIAEGETTNRVADLLRVNRATLYRSLLTRTALPIVAPSRDEDQTTASVASPEPLN
jgi:DNA invertase Pin-like site-specific DNA recombinase